ncbi:MAG: BBP7 family outer membrane beta-barrel protein [Gemmataceae bacterium]|nr:BBP7 family outer membrane beta-barrel protein [Gemmataceae bacterium]MDW8263835.1 BBP7 family outer membrane beta-barrel protein [Gemmataceae bacterium]
MRYGVVGAVFASLAGAGLVLAQAVPPGYPAPSQPFPMTFGPGTGTGAPPNQGGLGPEAGVVPPTGPGPVGGGPTMPPSGAGMLAGDGPVPNLGSGAAAGPAPVKISTNNAFGPHYTPNAERNAFGPDMTLPEEMHDNVYAPAEFYPVDRGPLVWASAEFLYWILSRSPLPAPAPITTSPIGSTGVRGLPFEGILGSYDTRVVYGGVPEDDSRHYGGRFTAGFWVLSNFVGAEGSYLVLNRDVDHFLVASNEAGVPLLARPVYNPITRSETIEAVAVPNSFSGAVSVANGISLWGWNADGIINPTPRLYNSGLLVGVRYLELDETMLISQTTNVLPGGLAAFNRQAVFWPNSLNIIDSFQTRNEFRGGEVGYRLQWTGERLFLNLGFKIAIGRTRQRLTIDGATTLLIPSGFEAFQVTVPGGLLAVATNIGQFTQERNSVIPEGTLNVGVNLTRNIHLFGGYTLLYWSNVIRTGTEVNRVVNPRLVPTSFQFGLAGGPPEPLPLFRQTNFWAQGVNFGLLLDF